MGILKKTKNRGSDRLDQAEIKLIKGLAATKDDYEFAELSANEFEELNNIERKLNQGKDREIVMLV